MKTPLGSLLALCTLVLGFLLTGCVGEDDEDPTAVVVDPATTTVEAHFRDSSVPPEYHRSWTLTLDQGQVRLVVDSYGDKIAEESVPMPQETWEEFIASLPEEVDVLDEPEPTDPGCTGGTGMTMDVDGDPGTHLDVDNCNTPGNEVIIEDVRELLEPFTDLVRLDEHTRA